MCDFNPGVKTKSGDQHDENDEDNVDNGQGRTPCLGIDIIWLGPRLDNLQSGMHLGQSNLDKTKRVSENVRKKVYGVAQGRICPIIYEDCKSEC